MTPVWRISLTLFCLCVIPLAALPVSAAPKLVVYEVEVQIDPEVQGLDLPIVVRARVGSGGACCYVVYGRDMKAEIIIPEGFTLLEGDPSQWLTSPGHPKGTVAARPGGGLTWLTVQWEVNCSLYGTFPISVTVTGTNDAGDSINFTSTAEVTIAPGAAISSPILPHRPVVGRETIVLANVTSRKGVSSVSLYYSDDKVTWTRLAMIPIEGDLYGVSIPSSPAEKSYWIYMESLDMSNETFRTGVSVIHVRDPARIASIAGSASLVVTAGSLGGIFLLLYFASRRASPFRKKGIFLVGDSHMEPALREREEMRVAQRRFISLRWRLLAALIIGIIVLFLLSLFTGQLEKVVSHTTSPQEALIRV